MAQGADLHRPAREGPLSAQNRRFMSLGAAADRRRILPESAYSKLIAELLHLKRSQTGEFRAVQKSRRPCENSA